MSFRLHLTTLYIYTVLSLLNFRLLTTTRNNRELDGFFVRGRGTLRTKEEHKL